MITVDDAAAILGVSRQRVWQLIKRLLLPAACLGRQLVLWRVDVLQYRSLPHRAPGQPTEYRRGYLDGWRVVAFEQAGQSGQVLALDEAQRQTLAEIAGGPMPDEAASDYWIGYYHGRYHRSHGEPPRGARKRGEVPPGL